MVKKPKRPANRSRGRKSNISAHKRPRRSKASTGMGGKRRAVRKPSARLDISIHEVPGIEKRGFVSKMSVAKRIRRAIL